MKVITKQWLEFAKADLLNCEQILNNSFLTNIIAFHSQQAVEKCFKAIIEEKDLKTERIHNLFKLHSIIEIYISFDIDLERLELLDNVYTNSRYPLDLGILPDGKPSLEQAKQLFDFAKYIYVNTLEMFEH